MRLPQGMDPAAFTAYRCQTRSWAPAVLEVCRQHGIPFTPKETFPDGSNLLAADDSLVVKIFPPFHRHQWESEWRALDHLGNHDLSLPIPRLLARGERHDGWNYVVVSRLPGVTLESVWRLCSRAEKIALMTRIGGLMAQVHALPLGDLADLDPPWALFLEKQRAQCRARHQRLGMPDWFLAEVDDFVAAHFPRILTGDPVILTGEYTPFNCLVEGSPGHWRLTGMIDFGDVMTGRRDYDFLGPLLFLGEGDPELIASLFAGYGLTKASSEAPDGATLLALAIMHRYSNLKSQIRIPGWESKVHSLAGLQALLFPRG